MDFDFNIILVPITLFLGAVWLLDKLWYRRRAGVRHPKLAQSSALNQAQNDLKRYKQIYHDALAKHGLSEETANNTNAPTTQAALPTEVLVAEREYRDAKRQANMVSSDSLTRTKPDNMLIRWARDYFPVLAVVLIVRSFIIEPFNIPSSSMVPTLYTGDFVAVNKSAYGIRLPLTYSKVLDTGSPKRGDVAVFRYPINPNTHYIKRIIGLPGDTVGFDNGQLTVNGQLVPTERVNFEADDVMTEQVYTPTKGKLSAERAIEIAQTEESGARYYQEQLGEHTYLRRYLAPSMQFDGYSDFMQQPMGSNVSWQVTVPENNYFVMGDNTDRSEDGRFWGFVPDENLSGKAFYVWMHKKPGLTNLPTFAYNRSID